MYEKIVESSRFCAMGYNGACDGCIFCGKSNDKDGECYQQLHKAAADAIEGLSGLVNHYGGETGIKDLNEFAGKYWDTLAKIPRWIPVTERLPEEAYACLAIVWDNNPYSGDTFLNYYPEFVGYDGESWNDYNGDEIPLDVVYWMKMPQIPEPPKEET